MENYARDVDARRTTHARIEARVYRSSEKKILLVGVDLSKKRLCESPSRLGLRPVVD